MVGLEGAGSYKWEAVVLEQQGLECEQRFVVGGGCAKGGECAHKSQVGMGEFGAVAGQ